jgi:uncharacterized protein
MALFGKKDKSKQTKLFFATDVHGGDSTFRKCVNAGVSYGVNIVILGGDIAGKMLVPVLDLGGGHWRATVQSLDHTLSSEDEVADFQKRVAKLGYYSKVVAPDEYEELSAHPEKVDQLYHQLAAERLSAWIDFAEQRLKGTGVRMYLTGGNDDSTDILEVIRREARENIIACEDEVVSLDDDGHTMLSLGLSNPTPWHTPREASEEVLAEHIEKMVAGISDFERVVFNLHAPPIDSTLDTCPKLDWSQDPPSVVTSGGTPVLYGAGSTAVRQAIEKYQPLLSLHGHIHETRAYVRIGRTMAVNPGSEYGEGVLRGCIVTMSGDKVDNVQMTAG